jgi:hypothetical protein
MSSPSAKLCPGGTESCGRVRNGGGQAVGSSMVRGGQAYPFLRNGRMACGKQRAGACELRQSPVGEAGFIDDAGRVVAHAGGVRQGERRAYSLGTQSRARGTGRNRWSNAGA